VPRTVGSGTWETWAILSWLDCLASGVNGELYGLKGVVQSLARVNRIEGDDGPDCPINQDSAASQERSDGNVEGRTFSLVRLQAGSRN